MHTGWWSAASLAGKLLQSEGVFLLLACTVITIIMQQKPSLLDKW